MTMGFDDGAEISAVVESPNVTINLPEGQPFSFIDSLFIVAGIMIWRNI